MAGLLAEATSHLTQEQEEGTEGEKGGDFLCPPPPSPAIFEVKNLTLNFRKRSFKLQSLQTTKI